MNAKSSNQNEIGQGEEEEMPWTEELEKAAARGEGVPDGLKAPERAYFIALRGLYYQYRVGIIDKDQAKREKVMLERDYKSAVLNEKCFEKSVKLWHILPTDIMKCECPECKRLAKLILGLN